MGKGPMEGDISGRAHVCFECGHCGLVHSDGSKSASNKACICGGCGDDSHTNFVELVLPGGRKVPWIERGPKASVAVAARPVQKTGRVKPNDPCPCGSGKKSKKCCHVGGA